MRPRSAVFVAAVFISIVESPGEAHEHPAEGWICIPCPVDHVYVWLHDTEGTAAAVVSAMERLWNLVNKPIERLCHHVHLAAETRCGDWHR
jgi:hypothetical protein